ncbi:hypothetical protein DMB92_03710 [Campylobacter sp. MIT 99-7217]|uniref:DUF262 domain-containing protein n=1 Tax=Campylobacter sp. MIT 99-7217 TaxID=535091 RepID=UPI00115C1B79|nr:DUF262 domain-containing protein [Campylobacter sp. MIT 99-7217]TQR33076.1 hypothetical protein DMB92_03710 [Campylobacter sp. MIT 99-7217]
MSSQNVKELFSKDKFSIPIYQRAYAWRSENFKDLWEDLEEALGREGHFLGTIVVAPNEKDSKKFDIIDGQQRITTIFMLLYALIKKGKRKDNLKTKLLLDEEDDLKLELIEENRDFFKRLLESEELVGLEEEADDFGKKNLCEVFGRILDKVANLNEEEVEKYRESLLEMKIMWLEEENAGRAIRTFQSVNDRGIALSLLDKLKSLLIYYSNSFCEGVNSLDSLINESFGEIFKICLKIKEHKNKYSIGGAQFKEENDIFRYHAGSIKFEEIDFLGSYNISLEDTYDKLKGVLKGLVNDRAKLSSFIEAYVKDLKEFYQSFLALLDEIDQRASVFKLFLIKKINPLFYNSLLRLKMKDELDDELIELFAKADIVFFNSGSEQKAKAYKLIHEALRSKEDFKKGLIREVKNVNLINNSINFLVNNAWNGRYTHYVFFEQNCKDLSIERLKKLIEKKEINQQIEHIIPKNLLEKGDEQALKKLGFEDINDFGNFLNSYGNILSLEGSLNTKASDKDLIAKAEVYEKSNIDFNRRFEVKNFNKAKLKERNKELEKWLKEEFFKEFLN